MSDFKAESINIMKILNLYLKDEVKNIEYLKIINKYLEKLDLNIKSNDKLSDEFKIVFMEIYIYISKFLVNED